MCAISMEQLQIFHRQGTYVFHQGGQAFILTCTQIEGVAGSVEPVRYCYAESWSNS